MKYFNQALLLIMSIHAVAFISGCSYSKKSVKMRPVYTPVFINLSLTMSAYMRDSEVVSNLSDELSTPWAIKVAVKKREGNAIRKVDSCNSILAAHNDGFEPIRPSLHITYQNALMQCRAIFIAVSMTPSKISYINTNLDKISVSNFPARIAFIPSKKQKSSIDSNAYLEKLNEVTPIIDFISKGNYEVELNIDGGSQTITVLAKGDVDGDQIEDLLIRVINAAEGGSYRATHLFVLSKKEKVGSWLLLSGY